MMMHLFLPLVIPTINSTTLSILYNHEDQGTKLQNKISYHLTNITLQKK